jgi:hypothetical protein
MGPLGQHHLELWRHSGSEERPVSVRVDYVLPRMSVDALVARMQRNLTSEEKKLPAPESVLVAAIVTFETHGQHGIYFVAEKQVFPETYITLRLQHQGSGLGDIPHANISLPAHGTPGRKPTAYRSTKVCLHHARLVGNAPERINSNGHQGYAP